MDMDLEPETTTTLAGGGANNAQQAADIENELRVFLDGGSHGQRDGVVPMQH